MRVAFRDRAVAAASLVMATVVMATAIAACSAAGGRPGPGAIRASQAGTWQAPTGKAATARPPGQAPKVGLFIDGGAKWMENFAGQTGVQPGIALNFSGWDTSFMASWASGVTADGATPLLQIAMGNHAGDVSAIASGADDGNLSSYAQAVRAFGHPVMLSFGHEMNGTWYSWGWKHVSPGTFVAAWRHIVTVFRDQGASNVTWLWTVQAYADSPSGTTSPAPWWPGSGYVDEVGVDGHYLYAGETFGKIFGKTLTDVRQLTSAPILIAETAISPKVGQQAMLPDLFSGVKSQGLAGFVYFDTTGNADYRLQTPAVLAAFGAAARQYGYAGVRK
ncbi:MAG TPA: glycosyl hydrolase [Trebonia sp.]|nr:glycosyl hydrolase [Trebonia sp.]